MFELKRELGVRITVWDGGVDAEPTLSFGVPEEVPAKVRERIRISSPQLNLSEGRAAR